MVCGRLPLVCSRSSHAPVVAVLYERAELEGERTIKSIRQQSTHYAGLAPSHYFKGWGVGGGKSFKSSVWLLNRLQLGYKHKLKGFPGCRVWAEVPLGLLY